MGHSCRAALPPARTVRRLPAAPGHAAGPAIGRSTRPGGVPEISTLHPFVEGLGEPAAALGLGGVTGLRPRARARVAAGRCR